MTVRIMLVDDHQLFREALRIMLEKEGTLEIVAETGNGLDVIPLVRKTLPDIVCMDISMPGMNGIEVTRCLLAVFPEIRIIGLSAFSDQRYIREMLDAGAFGYVAKAAAGEQLLQAITTVQKGQKHLCEDAKAALGKSVSPRSETPHVRAASPLGARERQVLQLIAEGQTSTEIGEQLGMALSTVEVHRRNLMRKLNLHSAAGLNEYAIRHI